MPGRRHDAAIRAAERVVQTFLSESIVSSDPADIGLHANTQRCTVAIDISPTGYIRCTLGGHPAIAGESITLRRQADGAWRCETSAGIDLAYRPNHCQ